MAGRECEMRDTEDLSPTVNQGQMLSDLNQLKKSVQMDIPVEPSDFDCLGASYYPSSRVNQKQHQSAWQSSFAQKAWKRGETVESPLSTPITKVISHGNAEQARQLNGSAPRSSWLLSSSTYPSEIAISPSPGKEKKASPSNTTDASHPQTNHNISLLENPEKIQSFVSPSLKVDHKLPQQQDKIRSVSPEFAQNTEVLNIPRLDQEEIDEDEAGRAIKFRTRLETIFEVENWKQYNKKDLEQEQQQQLENDERQKKKRKRDKTACSASCQIF